MAVDMSKSGAVPYSAVGELVFSKNSEVCKCILGANLHKSAKKFFKQKKWFFQQENKPNQKVIKVLGWPTQGPDLNPTGHLWDTMEKK